MKNLMREWGVPVGLLVAWVVAASWTLASLSSLQASELPVMEAPAMEMVADKPAS
jgi:hypothetical protein